MLNRAPTLHRLGIQAFEPVLVEGKAIQIHPLVCSAFNADFDGDQMAVHVPLSAEAQAEARILMLSTNNVLSPAHGRPIAIPTQDMILGLYYLTLGGVRPEKEEDIPRIASADEALFAEDFNRVHLHDTIKVRLDGKAMPPDMIPENTNEGATPLVETTVGRVILNGAFPDDFEYVNRHLLKGDVSALVDACVHRYDRGVVEQVLDNLKSLGFHYATRAGVTIGVEDVTTPASKPKILEEHEKRAQKVVPAVNEGILETDVKNAHVFGEIHDELGAVKRLIARS
jgi:DNA-directed RNA polymerase subunit beta'